MNAFMLAEVIVSAVLLGLLISLFFASLSALGRAETHGSHRAGALRVLDNTLERLMAMPTRTMEDTRKTLEAELEAADRAWPERAEACCLRTETGLELVIRQLDGPVLASVMLPWRKPSERPDGPERRGEG